MGTELKILKFIRIKTVKPIFTNNNHFSLLAAALVVEMN